jgi:Uma2 family endonuclease
MVQAQPRPTTISLTEFHRSPNLEESPAWELFDQVISQKPMPTLHHSILQKRLVSAIDAAGSDYEAFPELRCVLSTHSVVPDIAILSRDRQPMVSDRSRSVSIREPEVIGNQPVSGPPDGLIEILSPDQSTTKLIAKIQTCLQEGARLGWLIDATERIVMIFQPGQPLLLLRDQDRLPVLAPIGLQLTVAQLFNWLPPSTN